MISKPTTTASAIQRLQQPTTTKTTKTTTPTTAPFSPSFESHRLRKPTGGLISPSWDPLALTRAALQSSSKNAGHHTGHQKRPRQRVSATVKLLISLETGVNLGPSVGTSGSPGHHLLQINPRNPLLSNDILSRLSRETTTAVL